VLAALCAPFPRSALLSAVTRESLGLRLEGSVVIVDEVGRRYR
jgi:hypothetical protein